MSVGIAMIAVFSFLFLCMLAAIFALVYQKLAFQREHRALLSAGQSN